MRLADARFPFITSKENSYRPILAGGGKHFNHPAEKIAPEASFFRHTEHREGEAGACWTGCWTRWARSGLLFAPYEADSLHLRVGECLSAAGLPRCMRALLAPGCRIDYLVGGVGVEIKKGRPDPAALRRQLDRYAARQGVEALVVLTERAVPLPPACTASLVRGVALNRLWGWRCRE